MTFPSSPSTAAAAAPDEWTVVRKGSSKRVANPKRGKATKPENIHMNYASESSYASVETVLLHLKDCRKHLISSQFYQDFTSTISTTAGKTDVLDSGEDEKDQDIMDNVQEIVCYGIGTFSQKFNYSGPLWQLALALEIRSFLLLEKNKKKEAPRGEIKMVYFDPLVTPTERQVLQQLHVHVLDTNERGKRSIAPINDSRSTTRTTLFFMPHCPKGLYENVLWSNWDALGKDRNAICILGNSLLTYVELCSTDGSNTNSQGYRATSCLELALPFLEEQLIGYSKNDIRDMPGRFEAAFNDTYWIQFSSVNVTQMEGSDGETEAAPWPGRPLEPSEAGQDEVI